MAAGITNHVFDPASIAVDQRARRVKTDRIDGEKMLRTLMAYLRGEPQVVRIVRVPAAVQMTERSELLLRLKCLGPAFATTLASEVFYKDFRNRREVASYFGLTPSPWRSGGIDRDQGISKAGNPRARCAAIELAWLWLRRQPDSKLTQEYRRRTLDAGKRIKRVAIVALARKLVVALWRYLTTGLVPEGAVLKAVKM